MPLCQAWGCNNRNDRGNGVTGFGKKYFQIPNPWKYPDKKDLADRWLHNIGTGWNSLTFKFARHKVVCQDHFAASCFQDDLHTSLLGTKPRLILKADAVPTLVVHRRAPAGRSRELRLKKRNNTKVVAELLSPGPSDPRIYKGKKKKLRADDLATHSTQINISTSSATQTVSVQTDDNCCNCGQDVKHKCIIPVSEYQVNLDHSYTQQTSLIVQKSHVTCIELANMPQSSPIKILDDPMEVTAESSDVESDITNDSNLNSSFMSLGQNDPYFGVESDISSDTDSEPESNPIDEIISQDKYIVFSNSLDELFFRIPCSQCSCPVDEIKRSLYGSMITAKLYCTGGHEILFWKSQPFICPRASAGNVLLSAGILLTGQTYKHVADVASLINLKFVGKSTYYDVQRDYLLPAIEQYWKNDQISILSSLQNSPVQVTGDGRCDSPGYSARYCNYTMMDHSSHKILDFEVVEVTEAKSSTGMEKIGFERVLDRLTGCAESDHGLTLDISDVSTDRHVSVRKLMKDKYKPMNIEHQFDPYHMANSLRKNLQEKCRYKKYSVLTPWVQSICNHLWWCAASCNGDAELLVARWESLCNHIVNCHNWQGTGLVTACYHAPLSDSELRVKKWLTEGSAAHNVLKEIVLNKRFLADIKLLSKFLHTGMLEVYHSLLNKYCPKRQDFDKKQMVGRTQLAVLDHNHHTSKADTTCDAGASIDPSGVRVAYSKHCRDWVIKPIAAVKSYSYLTDLLADVLRHRSDSEKGEVISKPYAKNISRKPKPTKEFLIKRHVSRLT